MLGQSARNKTVSILGQLKQKRNFKLEKTLVDVENGFYAVDYWKDIFTEEISVTMWQSSDGMCEVGTDLVQNSQCF